MPNFCALHWTFAPVKSFSKVGRKERKLAVRVLNRLWNRPLVGGRDGGWEKSYHELAWATHCLVAVMKASGLKSPPNHTVLERSANAPDEDTDLEIPSSCLTLWQKSLIHWITVVLGGILYKTQDWNIREEMNVNRECSNGLTSRWNNQVGRVVNK